MLIKRKRILCCVLAIALTAGACTDEQRKKIAQASDDIARGLHTALALDEALIKQQLVSKDDALAITTLLLDVNRAAKEFNDKARAFGSIDATEKAELLRMASDMTASVATLNQQGVLRIKNQQSQIQFLAAIAIIQGGVAVLTSILQGGK